MAILRADKLMESSLGFDKMGIGQLRNVEYSKKYLWEVSFSGRGDNSFPPPKPFEDFIPATDVDMDEAILETYKFEQYMSSYEVPWKTGNKGITITFNDNEDNTLFKWISDWINIDILNHGHFISALLDDHFIVEPDGSEGGNDSFGFIRRVVPLRLMKLSLLSSGRSKVLTRQFLVFPLGKLSYNGSQASQAQAYSMSFAIVSEIRDPYQLDKADLLDKIKESAIDLFGRFI